jgi:RNA polymerase sigma-70 factor (ECF subfamily)
MSDPSVDTVLLQQWLNRLRAGDLRARDELLARVCHQLERQARKMLRRFPNVQPWAETGDVLQSALLRLFRGLQQMEPPSSMAQFYALAAQHMRRELLDLARHHCAAHRPGMQHASQLRAEGRAPEPADPGDDPAELERWCRFHQEVEKLPVEEREVVGLLYYHGWQQAQAAGLLHITERTVRRRWRSAMARLHDALEESPPSARVSAEGKGPAK